MMTDNRLAELPDRHRAFWECSPVDRPLVGTSRWPYITMRDFDWHFGAEEGELRPEMLRLECLLPQYERWYQLGGACDGDFAWPASPPRCIPWIEGILGCPIHYSFREGAIFAQPLVQQWPAPGEIGVALDQAWLSKLVEFIARLGELSDGRFAIAGPLTRGPWDLVAALRGMSSLYYDLYDNPTRVIDLAERCVGTWRTVNDAVARALPRWSGGYVGYTGIWAPEFPSNDQNDASVSVSGAMYRELMARFDAETATSRRYCVFHLHSVGLQVVDSVLKFLDGRALNIALDPTGPPLSQVMPVLRRVQDGNVPLHIWTCRVSELQELQQQLSPRGLAIWYQPEGS